MRNFVFGTAIAIGVSTGVLTGGSAEAQSSLATGCTAVSGGALNQSVGPGGSGITAVLVESFAAGETITVTITNASNSLFDISGTTTLFSGEVGTLTRSYVFFFRGHIYTFVGYSGGSFSRRDDFGNMFRNIHSPTVHTDANAYSSHTF
jgi:hypothetical protein